MKIDLTELLQNDGNEADIKTSLGSDKIETDSLVLTQPIQVKVHLTNTGNSVLVNGSLTTEIELECSRCLKSFKQPITVKLEEEYSPAALEHHGKGETELTASDFVYPIEKDNSLDLKEMIRQNLLLALPIRPLCQPDCQGILIEEKKK